MKIIKSDGTRIEENVPPTLAVARLQDYSTMMVGELLLFNGDNLIATANNGKITMEKEKEDDTIPTYP